LHFLNKILKDKFNNLYIYIYLYFLTTRVFISKKFFIKIVIIKLYHRGNWRQTLHIAVHTMQETACTVYKNWTPDDELPEVRNI